MKKILTIFLFFLTTAMFAAPKNYYVSTSDGNDGFNGLSPSTPWKTTTRVNTAFAATVNPIVAGDSILFKCGDVFLGQVWVQRNGTTALPIVIGSYLTGAKPILSGFTTLTGWANVSGNIWQVTPAVTLKKNVNILTINGVPQAVGRTNWFTFQSATTTQVTSSSLTGTPNYTGAEIVIRKNTFVAEKLTITAQSGGTLTVTNVGQQSINNSQSAAPIAGKAGNGFFIQRVASALDQQGEWFFNQSTNKMQIYSTSNPSGFTIKASYVDTIIKLAGSTNIVVTNIAVEGGGLYAIESYGAANIQVRNCDLNNNTKGIYIWNSNDALADGNNIENSFNGAIQINNHQAKRITVTNNYIHNTGQLIGMGVFNNEHALRGIVARTSNDGSQNYVYVNDNVVRNTGNAPILFQGSNVQILRNVTDSFANQLDDMGGIYTFVENRFVVTPGYTNRLIANNFISNGIGAPLGSAGGHVDVVGLYLDDQSGYIRCQDNTIWNINGSGIQWNNPINDTLVGNTVFNSDSCMTINQKEFGPMTGNLIKKNFFYPLTTTQIIIFYTNSGLSNPTGGGTQNNALNDIAYIDSNYYRMKKTNGFRYWIAPSQGANYVINPDVNITKWRDSSGHDIRTLEANPATIVTLWTNPSDNLLVVTFTGLRKVDPIGNIYDHTATVDRWESLLLLDAGNAPVASNVPPTANAGSTVTVTLPTSTATLNGSGTDTDGTISSYVWIKVSGPAGGTIATPNAATTNLSALQQGTYVYQLTVTDNLGATGNSSVNVVVNPAVIPNTPPTSNAGSTVTITLPQTTATLNGSGADTDGTITGYLWTKVSGPAGGTIATANAASTNLSALQQGTYVYNLEVTDDDGATGNSSVNVVVNPAVVFNTPPTSNAGSTITIQLPTSTTTLNGSGSDVDGTITMYAWTKVSGPTGGTIASPASASTNISALQQGTYVFDLQVTDNGGLTGNSSVNVVVNAANVAPTADAGANIVVTLPANSTTLFGSGSDVDGTISSYSWTKLSGPAGGTIASSSSASTGISALQQGTYQYRLTVTDNQGATGQASVQVRVDPAIIQPNIPPTVSAGPDGTVTGTTYTLTGFGYDNDGYISSYLWRKIGGPAAGSITTPTDDTTGLTGLTAGIYFFEIRAIDNSGDSAKATMQLTVSAVNTLPVSDAGPARSLTLPTDTITLFGSGTDADGTISTYSWTKEPGSPAGGAISTPNAASTLLTGLLEGVYYYTLVVTDNSGGTATSTVQVTVNPVVPLLAPTADAGPAKQITLPRDTVTLFGIGTDADGTIVTYAWVQLFGPSPATITPSSAATTVLSNLQEGIYQFELTVTDNDGLQDTSTVYVTVLPVNVLVSNFLIFLNTYIRN